MPRNPDGVRMTLDYFEATNIVGGMRWRPPPVIAYPVDVKIPDPETPEKRRSEMRLQLMIHAKVADISDLIKMIDLGGM